jgi:hypothetical protein
MHLIQVVEDNTKMMTGYEEHTFRCPGCHEVERRPVFTERRKAPIRRNVQIVDYPDGSYAAQDTKSGMVVMHHRNRERLRELCEWIGWRVVAAAPHSTDRAMSG